MSDEPEQTFTTLSIEELQKIVKEFGFGQPKQEPPPKGCSRNLWRRKGPWQRERTW